MADGVGDVVYEIEFVEPILTSCDCCGLPSTRLVRFVARDGEAFAIYRAILTRGPRHPRAEMIVGLGDWDEAASPEDRVAFAFQLWSDDSQCNIGIVGPEQTAWSSGVLGRILAREEALRHPRLKDVFDLSDHIVGHDRPLADYLDGRES
ncbi:MAG: hypothetical protein JF625_06670 [Inquilinus limosus]|uniref:Uncharacterized protein n=1 Tax=Inquilinus limosus TaxID=171674 RepID=A0A952KJM3_9PROT|nr:hypothetical protein [Inquilinus limosus]